MPPELNRRKVLRGIGSAPLLKHLWSPSASPQTDLSVTESADSIHIENERVRLTFLRENGGLYQLRDKQTGVELRDSASPFPETLWVIWFYRDPDEGPLHTGNWLAGEPTYDIRAGDSKSSIRFRWENPTLRNPRSGEPQTRFKSVITVDVTVRTGEPFARFGINIENQSQTLDIKEFSCPSITAITPLASDNSDSLIIPTRSGRRYPDPTEMETIPHHLYPSGFGTMQFSAYLNSDGGYYADARDTEGYVKRIVWEPDSENGVLNYKMAQLETMDPGGNVSRPYDTTFGVLSGDWYDAANRYRRWLDTEGWLRGVTKQPPGWLQDLGAIYRIELHPDNDKWDYPVDDAADLVRDMKEYLNVDIGFQLGDWQASQNGDWLPPREGWETFERTIQALLQEGIRSSLLVGATFYGKNGSLFEKNEDAKNWIVRKRNGEPVSVGETHYLMEVTHDGWQSFLRTVIRKLVDAGITEIQYDGVPWNLPECFDEDHDHELGRGGNWWSLRSRTEIAEIRQLLRNQGAISGEGTCDFYLPYFDVFPTRDVFTDYLDADVQTGTSEVIPIVQYTFGDLQVTRNQNHEPLDLAPELDRLFNARALLWGAIPVFRYPNRIEGETPGALRHFRRIARARAYYGNRFVAKGAMLRSPSIKTETVELQGHSGVVASADVIQTSAWKSDADELGIFMMNIAPHESRSKVEFDPSAQPFSVGDTETLWYIVRNGSYEQLMTGNGPFELDIANDDVLLLVKSPSDENKRAALNRIIEAEDEINGATERKTLNTAKRAFEGGDFESAVKNADAVITGTPTSRQNPKNNGRTSTEENSTTSADADGFGIMASLAAMGGYIMMKLGSSDEGR